MGRKRKKPQPRYVLRADKPPPQIPQPIAPQHNTEKGGNTSSDVLSAGVLVPISPQGPQSPVSDNEAREHRAEYRDQWRLRVEIGSLFVGLVGIAGLLITLLLTREANTLARDAIKQTQDIMQGADRPWVGIVNMGMIEFQVGKKMKIRVGFQNSGKTPALQMRSSMGQAYVRGIPDKPPAIKIDVPYQGEVVVTPNQSAGSLIVSETELSMRDFNEITNGQQTVVVWGTIVYTDKFHIEGETTLCMIYSPIGEDFYGCTHGNDAK